KPAGGRRGLDRQGPRRRGREGNGNVDLVLVVEVDVQVVRGQLDAVGGGRTRDEPHIEDGRNRDGHRLETAAARLRHRRADLAGHEDLGPVPLQAKLDPPEPPRRVSEDGPERPHFSDAQPLFRYVGNTNDHERETYVNKRFFTQVPPVYRPLSTQVKAFDDV